jgi:hypothetical protein
MQIAIRRRGGCGGSLLILVVATLWAGLLTGVSFIATPAKFMAPSLSLPVALDVGRQTFLVFNRFEIGIAVVLLALLTWHYRTWFGIGLGGVMLACVLVETIWLLPLLDARVTIIIAGGVPPPSSLHRLYIGIESIKLLGLFILIVQSYRLIRSEGERIADRNTDPRFGPALDIVDTLRT